ncbi:MAG: hypothetical protein AB7P03_19425 [Kofleriaceae bacterium]
MSATFARWSSIVIGLAVVSCSSEDISSPPEISDLAFSPAIWPVGQTSAVNGSVAVHDLDGDVKQLGMVIRHPDGTERSLPLANVPANDGTADTKISIVLAMMPSEPGHYTFDIWVIDALGHESNRLTGEADAR